KVFDGLAARGKTSMGWFYGLKLHFVINHKGQIMALKITPGNTVLDEMTRHLAGKLYADKGYIGRELFHKLWRRGLHLITSIRRNMRNYLMPLADKVMLRKRFVIETVLDTLKSEMGVRRGKAALSSGCKPHPANSLPPEAIGAVMEVTRWLKPSISVSRIGDSASGQAATRVNAEQASKRMMCRLTRHPYRGRLIWLGRMSEAYPPLLHRGRGGGMSTRKAHATREALWRGQGCPTGGP
ncbi:MAG: transposase, partial [Pseudomonadota bacterium]|nr:transposase [Pseudomonadota bacterium]